MYDLYSDEYFMQMAFEQAEIAAEQGEIPVGAVIRWRNEVIAKAYNQCIRLNDPTAHAEMLAITAACEQMGSRYLNECTLYVTLEPCCMCGGATQWAQLGSIIYAAPDEKKGILSAYKVPFNKKVDIKSGILKEKCEGLLLDFFQKLRT